MNRKEAYESGIRCLEKAGFAEAKPDVLMLMDGLFHLSMTDILSHGETELTKEEQNSYKEALHKRMQHIPVQYITGVQEFMGLSFCVNEHVLIPRQDTEILVEEVLKQLHDGFSILDMCTGSGCIILSLLQYSNDCEAVGADISAEALNVAKKNAERLGKTVKFVQSDLFKNISGRFDLIVSNPPYIRSDVIDTLMDEVRLHEPLTALDGKEDGLYFYRRIISESRLHLNRGGMIFFEIGYDQGKAVYELLQDAGFRDIETVRDYAGLDRVVYGSFYG